MKKRGLQNGEGDRMKGGEQTRCGERQQQPHTLFSHCTKSSPSPNQLILRGLASLQKPSHDQSASLGLCQRLKLWQSHGETEVERGRRWQQVLQHHPQKHRAKVTLFRLQTDHIVSHSRSLRLHTLRITVITSDCSPVLSLNVFIISFIFWANVNWTYCISAWWTLLWTRSFWCLWTALSQFNFGQKSARFPSRNETQLTHCKQVVICSRKTPIWLHQPPQSRTDTCHQHVKHGGKNERRQHLRLPPPLIRHLHMST